MSKLVKQGENVKGGWKLIEGVKLGKSKGTTGRDVQRCLILRQKKSHQHRHRDLNNFF